MAIFQCNPNIENDQILTCFVQIQIWSFPRVVLRRMPQISLFRMGVWDEYLSIYKFYHSRSVILMSSLCLQNDDFLAFLAKSASDNFRMPFCAGQSYVRESSGPRARSTRSVHLAPTPPPPPPPRLAGLFVRPIRVI